MADKINSIIDAGYLPAITDLRQSDAPFSLVVTYDDGVELVTDMTGIIHKRQALAALRNPDDFSRVKVINNGDGVEWECGVDFSADALRQIGGGDT